MLQQKIKKLITFFILLAPIQIFAFVLTGQGNFALRAKISPKLISKNSENISGLEPWSLFKIEAIANEKLSAFFELNFTRDFLGDTITTREDQERKDKYYQDPFFPQYESLNPKVQQLYIQYLSDYFKLSLGRKKRSTWGLGILYDSGDKAFDTTANILDGINFSIDPNEHQALGFELGINLLQETLFEKKDENIIPEQPKKNSSRMWQFLAAVVYDDSYQDLSSFMSKKIGIIYSKTNSSDVKQGGSETEINNLDISLDLYLSFIDINWKNEFLMIWGKTAAPSSKRLGGASEDQDAKSNDSLVVNEIDSNIAFASHLRWDITKTLDPLEKNPLQRTLLKSQSILFDFAFAPGDQDGYFDDEQSKLKRKKTIKAIALHPNYSPTLIFFKHTSSQFKDLRVDGIFEPNQIVNAQVYSLAYQYVDWNSLGSLEARVSYARLQKNISAERKAELANSGEYKIGSFGKELGFELDLRWRYKPDYRQQKNLDFGVDIAYVIVGNALKIEKDKDPNNGLLFQADINFKL
jgi:hypothetical protein